ncbi:MAG: cell wall-binding protein, partial [Oribacterium parvum]|nr:cell wall-binding protein [Oribacterium parvum]
SGKGATGIKQDYVYFNGRLQKADKGSHYQKITLPGQNRSYVINEAGRVMKSKTKYRDADGNKWSVNASGVITLDEGLDTVELLSPTVTDID